MGHRKSEVIQSIWRFYLLLVIHCFLIFFFSWIKLMNLYAFFCATFCVAEAKCKLKEKNIRSEALNLITFGSETLDPIFLLVQESLNSFHLFFSHFLLISMNKQFSSATPKLLKTCQNHLTYFTAVKSTNNRISISPFFC